LEESRKIACPAEFSVTKGEQEPGVWPGAPLLAAFSQGVKSMDWAARKAAFRSKANPALLTKVRAYLAVLLGLR